MKKILTSGIVLSVLAGIGSASAAISNPEQLTTKGYVDSGIKWVYDQITESNGDLSALTQRVSTNETNIGNNATNISNNASAISGIQSYIGTQTAGKESADSLTVRVEGLEDDLGTLDNFVGDADMGTTAGTVTGAIGELNTRITNVQSGAVYTQGEGVVIDSNRVVSVKGANATTGADGKMYVFKNNQLSEMPVATEWNSASFLGQFGE